MTSPRMREIITSRGIEGLVVFGPMQAPYQLDFDFTGLAASVIGRGIAKPRLDAVGSNLHYDLLLAISQSQARGYSRPGLALEKKSASHSLHCWEASYWLYDAGVAPGQRIPVCIYDGADLSSLQKWFKRYQPDCVLGLAETTYGHLQSIGIALPRQAGFITLVQDDRIHGITGIDLLHVRIAAKAVDIVVEKLRRNEYGLPDSPELTLYDGIWIEGLTLPPKPPSPHAAVEAATAARRASKSARTPRKRPSSTR